MNTKYKIRLSLYCTEASHDLRNGNITQHYAKPGSIERRELYITSKHVSNIYRAELIGIDAESWFRSAANQSYYLGSLEEINYSSLALIAVQYFLSFILRPAATGAV